MNDYIGKIKYSILDYGSEGKPEEHTATHLIKANSPEEAYDKIRDYYIAKTEEYSCYYDVLHIEIFSCIE